jgi:5-methylcytosine-specific restriction endonuclease McrBC GTP-binding regulatory subunit McrB
MNPIFQHPSYLLKRQVFALAGTFRFYDPSGNLVMFSQQKMFKLREDIRVFSDENKSQEVLSIKARQIIDFSAAYDVVDSVMNQKVGTLRRKGWSSMLRDEWQVLDANDNQLGVLFEDSMGLALLRRFLLGSWLPQNYDIAFGEKRVADLKQNFNLFRYELNIDFSMDTAKQLDPRLGIAAGILLAAVEGRQSG